MKKTINFCGNCPFKYSDYDDYALGYSTVTTCTLSKFLKLEDDCILVSDGDAELKTPIWCPLKTDEFTFDFKEFSTERKIEIDSTLKKIEVLQNYFDNTYDVDYDNPDVIEKNTKLQTLYTTYNELQSNEDVEYDFQTELNKSIDEIKIQLSTLESVGNKLQESINNLGE